MDWESRREWLSHRDAGVQCAELWDGIGAELKACDAAANYAAPTVPREKLEHWREVVSMVWGGISEKRERHVEGVPMHYRGDGMTTCSDAMASMMARDTVKGLTRKRLRPIEIAWWGLAFRYLWRWPRKGAPVEDLDKLIDCAQRLKAEVQQDVKQD